MPEPTLTITNTAGGMRGFGRVRFPVGASTLTGSQLRLVAEHPHFRDAVDAGWLTVTPDGAPDAPPATVSGDHAPLPVPDVSHGTHVPELELTDDELMAQLEAEEAERLRAAAGGTSTQSAQ